MRILKTGHIIADTVAAALEKGLYEINRRNSDNSRFSKISRLTGIDVNIAYGILRGASEMFKQGIATGIPYIHLDRGYFKPSHFDGYYRVSLNGTQQATGLDQFEDDARFKQLGIEVKPWRGFDKSKPVLICVPSLYVEEFFNPSLSYGNYPKDMKNYWLKKISATGILKDCNTEFRSKSLNNTNTIINFHDYNYVLTLNSSVGWQALQNGIPCVSDPTHSIVGSRYHNISLDNLEEAQYIDRHKLFAVMANLQLSLDEIRAGTKLWELLSKLLNLTSLSDSTAESQSPLMWPRTAF